MRFNIIEISEDSAEYPFLLKQTKNHPKKIFVLGNLELLNRKCISIVGCRDCSKYGAKISEKLAFNISKNNIIVVSGLAEGIDKFAHIGALKASGKTIAVVAHGLDMIYPPQNRSLAKEILINGGTIISEYPIKTKPKPEFFPNRNRIISGLSNETIIVEAKEKSGSLITANFTLEQNRNLYAVPGSIFSKNSYGTNLLIKQGAEPIIDIENINNLNFT